MKVSNDPQQSKEYLAKLNSGLRDRIVAKEKEIEKVDQFYNKKIENAKIQGEEKILAVNDQTNQRIEVAANDYEQKLNDYRNHLISTKDKLNYEENQLKLNNEISLHNLKLNSDQRFLDNYQAIEDNHRLVQSDANDKLKMLSYSTNNELTRAKSNAQLEMSKVDHQNNLEFNKKQNEFQIQSDGQSKTHLNTLRAKEDEFKLQLRNSSNDQKRIIDETTRIQNDRLGYLEKFHQSLMLQKEEDFKVKYQNIVKQHEEVLKDIQKKFEEEVRHLQNSTSEQKQTINEKSKDDFYRIKTIQPRVLDHENHMVFELDVPKHEWENVHLSAQGRNVKMTIGRKYADEATDDQGIRNKSSRSELFSREFTVKDLLNPKTMKQTYADGVLKFKIDKL